MFYVRTKSNLKIAVYDSNPCNSRVIIMLHGWMLSEKIFEYQKNFFMDTDYRIITLDFRGFGNSDSPDFCYNYDNFAEDLHAVVTKLQLRNFILLGFDMGGAVAIRYITKYPNNGVSKLALLAATAPSYTQRPGFSYGVSEEFIEAMIKLAGEDRARLSSDYTNCLLYGQHSSAIINWFDGIALSSSSVGTIKSAIALRDEDLRHEVRRINIPTGIFHGLNDRLVPYELAEVLQQAIPFSVLYPFENCGHALFYDAKNDFNNQFREFIEEVK